MNPHEADYWQHEAAENEALTLERIATAINVWATYKGFWPPPGSCEDEGCSAFGTEHEHTRNFGELIALMHSELSEALEAHRTDAKDKHLPQFDGVAVELADCLIRILDTCAAYGIPIGRVVMAKMVYNAGRPHKHGKKY